MESENKYSYDLEERTARFAEQVRQFIRLITLDIPNKSDALQLSRSSGSVAANYIEASEALSKRDFFHRIKICRKEAKESMLWLRLILVSENNDLQLKKDSLKDEARQLMLIFNSILKKDI